MYLIKFSLYARISISTRKITSEAQILKTEGNKLKKEYQIDMGILFKLLF